MPKYTLHVQVRGRERAHPRRRGPHGRRAGRDRRQASTPARDSAGHPIALLNLKLNKNVQPLPGRLDVRRPAQGRDRPEVPRDDAGDIEPTLPRRRDRAAEPDRRGGRPRPGAVDVRSADAHRRRRRRRSASATRSPAAAATSTTRSARSCRSLTRSGSGDAQPGVAADRPRRLLPRARGVLERARAGGPDAGDAVREPRHDVPGARRRRGAVPAGLDLRDARRRSAR